MRVTNSLLADWASLGFTDFKDASQDLLFIPTKYSSRTFEQSLPQLLKFWLSIGCDTEMRHQDDATPLLAVVAASETARVSSYLQLLIDNGANVHAQKDSGQCALHLAVHVLIRVCHQVKLGRLGPGSLMNSAAIWNYCSELDAIQMVGVTSVSRQAI